ncbi:hypothetical protein [Jatrophihabitans sp.]|jgi:hypothetical protein|uniref:hypothetical protein n=1 Tax=Jatrophihabitans sp. TaxID=1932789 RepID=UPI002F0A9BEA
MRKCILVLGYGILGGRVVDEIARAYPDADVHVGGRDAERLSKRVNLTRYASLNYGPAADLHPVPIDVLRSDELASLLRTIKPDLILNTTSLVPWWRIDMLPATSQARLKEAGSGIWAAPDLLPALRVREVLTRVEYAGMFVNGSYPDLINMLIHDPNVGPICGVGNVANVVPGIRLACAELLGCNVCEIQVRLVAHHYVAYNVPVTGTTNGAPCRLQVIRRGIDVSDRLSQELVFRTVASKFARVKGIGGEAVAVSSAMSVINPLLLGSRADCHAPGVAGLPGGYPIVIDHRRVRLDLPSGMSVDEATSINSHGGQWDGIQAVTSEGEVVVTDRASRICKDLLGYDPDGVTAANCEAKAFEMIEKFERYSSAVGV